MQDALGIAFCLYMLKTVRLPTFKVLQPCQNKRFGNTRRLLTLLLLLPLFPGVHLIAERPLHLRRFLRIHHALLNKRTSHPFCRNKRGACRLRRLVLLVNTNAVCLLQSGESIMVEVAAGPSDSATHEKVSSVTPFASPVSCWMESRRSFAAPSSFPWC